MALTDEDKSWFISEVRAANAELLVSHIRAEHLDLDRRLSSVQKQVWGGAGGIGVLAILLKKLWP